MLAGRLRPQSGSVALSASICYCPQDQQGFEAATVAGVLGLADKIAALRRIAGGGLAQADFDLLNDDWDVERNLRLRLEQYDLAQLEMERPFAALSAGQKTRLLLVRAILSQADFLLFDEPTNNLDIHARRSLYDFVANAEMGLLMVSHDRTLLRQCDEIIELSSMGVNVYGGNFDAFAEQKRLKDNAVERQYEDAKQDCKKAQRAAQQAQEAFDKKSSVGRKLFLDGHIDRISANAKRGRAEKTIGRMSNLEERMLASAGNRLDNAKQMREVKEAIRVVLPKTSVPNGKVVLTVEALGYRHPGAERALFDGLDLTMVGPERVALIGRNGVGKSTLLKLICAELTPTRGTASIGVAQWNYLSQDIGMLWPQQSVLENFQRINADLSHHDCHHALAQLKFRNKDAQKLAGQLSGGERIRAGLACVLMSSTPPQLLLLDEPSNHLDLASLVALEDILNQYQGALLLVSHDASFLERVKVGRHVSLADFSAELACQK
ncbi:ABC-F family ATP-binding cassette domain-containing protein [Rugamonas violacea]